MKQNTQPSCYQIEIKLEGNEAFHLADALEELPCTVSCLKEDESEDWFLRIFFEDTSLEPLIRQMLSSGAREIGLTLPDYHAEKLDDIDWVSETQKKFKPFSVGKFFIHSSYYKDTEIPVDAVALEIDARMAFGTGEHQTTTGCLQAISELADSDFNPKNILDMGCGSGILAMAAGKIWPQAQIVAADIEEPSVEVTKENFELNQIQNPSVVVESDGYQSVEIKQHAPYDLILCNILAGPLVDLAPELKQHLAANGSALLSGLLAEQEEEVAAAHEAQGLNVKQRFPVQNWMSLLIGA